MDGGLGQVLVGEGAGAFRPLGPRESGVSIPYDAKGLAMLDTNGDARPDFAIGTNSGPWLAYQHHRQGGHAEFVAVRLRGPRGNPTGVGARVAVLSSTGTSQTAEVYAGSGYLSQSTATLFFGIKKASAQKEIEAEVRWPDGEVTKAAHPWGHRLEIRHSRAE
jgi:hypothetical protein